MADKKEIATNRLLNLLRETEEKDSIKDQESLEITKARGIQPKTSDTETAEQAKADQDFDVAVEEIEESDEDEFEALTGDLPDEDDISEDLLSYIFEEPSEVDKVRVKPEDKKEEPEGQGIEVGESEETEPSQESSEEQESLEEGSPHPEEFEVEIESHAGEEEEAEGSPDHDEAENETSSYFDLELDEDALKESVDDKSDDSLDFDFEEFVTPTEDREETGGKDVSPEIVSKESEERTDDTQPDVDAGEEESAEARDEDASARVVSQTGIEMDEIQFDESLDLEKEAEEETADDMGSSGELEVEDEVRDVVEDDLDAEDPGADEAGFEFEMEGVAEEEEDDWDIPASGSNGAEHRESEPPVFHIGETESDTGTTAQRESTPAADESFWEKTIRLALSSGIPQRVKSWLDLPDLREIAAIFPIQKTCIGIDISEYSLKYVKLRKGKKATIEDYHYEVFPVEMIEDPRSRKAHVEEILHGLLDGKETFQSYVHTTVVSSEISIRNISLPQVSKSDLDTAVQWSSKKSLPMDVNDAVIDYKVVGEIEESGVKKNDVLVVAALEKDIESQIKFWESFDLIPNKISLHPIAAWNAFKNFVPDTGTETVMLVELGANSSFICVITKGKLRFVRMISVSDSDFTEALTGNISTGNTRINIGMDLANRLKDEYGLPLPDAEGKTDEGISYAQISSRFRLPVERLAKEIQRSHSYYQKEISDGKISRIFVSGEAARIKNLEYYLQEELKNTGGLDIDLEIMDPLSQVEFDEHLEDTQQFADVAPAFAVPLGLATDRSNLLNMLPKRLKDLPKFALVKVGTLAATFILILSMIIMSTVTGIRLEQSREQLDQV
ncbi:MAG: type IV pilus assembly protein PilM [Candidatus Marinimicrobia bacterium]|nr:type IV pilus assembly protein PilM [Candidatus Neomarinimicrobiota bacterium]MCF7830182.1 type IV pilus assembly protein PilM [Candidatus Neomarinimicrobiota bacterium]MCF7882084.1 type IV pilus assembly protein PilM [Candidatus Neomarinimicrobiota bacterium]